MTENSVEVGVIKELHRYHVKSMHGEELQSADISMNGIPGDRRYSFVRSDNQSDFPWLTARQIPRMLLYRPYFTNPDDAETSEVRVVTPDGRDLALTGDELLNELQEQHDGPIHLTHKPEGIYDAVPISVITTSTLKQIGEATGVELSAVQFRPTIVVEAYGEEASPEVSWVDCTLQFGEGDDAVRVYFDGRDVRCMMINLDPVTAKQNPKVLREVVAKHSSCAGIYGLVRQPGKIKVGDKVRVIRD